MLSEAARTKVVLSSNKEATLFIEGIMEGIDFNEKITRK
jgi:molecular chaperone DnaK (HSP70)